MTDFQSLSGQQGRHYETAVRSVLRMRGWTVENDRPEKLVIGEVDIIAIDSGGRLWWIECKGSYRNQPGLLRLDTTLKAIASAWLIREFFPDRPPYAVWTTNRPKAGSKGDLALARAIERGLIDDVVVFGGFQ